MTRLQEVASRGRSCSIGGSGRQLEGPSPLTHGSGTVVALSPSPPGSTAFRGGAIKRSIWIPAWERETWITLAEILVLGVVVMMPGTGVRLALGLPLLGHLGWTTLTSLPMGKIPGPPAGVKERRRNHDLRTRVVAFLKEVQRVERYVQQAEVRGLPASQLGESLRSAERRMLATAEEVVKMTGRLPELHELGRVERPGLERGRIDRDAGAHGLGHRPH